MAKVRSWAGLDVHAARCWRVMVDAESGELRCTGCRAIPRRWWSSARRCRARRGWRMRRGRPGTGSLGRCWRRGSDAWSRRRGRSSGRRGQGQDRSARRRAGAAAVDDRRAARGPGARAQSDSAAIATSSVLPRCQVGRSSDVSDATGGYGRAKQMVVAHTCHACTTVSPCCSVGEHCSRAETRYWPPPRSPDSSNLEPSLVALLVFSARGALRVVATLSSAALIRPRFRDAHPVHSPTDLLHGSSETPNAAFIEDQRCEPTSVDEILVRRCL